MTHIARAPLSRRTLLRNAGVAIALPFLEAMRPAFGQAAKAAATDAPRRMLAICTNLGLLSDQFFPEKSGSDYELSPYLQTLLPFRDRFTVISGTSHPDVSGGHPAEYSFLTAAPQPGTASFRNTISLDQLAAQQVGHLTRVASLPLVVAQSGNQSLSISPNGVMVPAERSPARVFRSLFTAGDAAAMERQIEKLRIGRSVLDAVADRATTLERRLGTADRERLNQYFTAVREVERRLVFAEEWERKPKPTVHEVEPQDGVYLLDKLAAMFSLIRLALATDSTRIVTLLIKLDGFGQHIQGVSDECHSLSHHVGRADKIEQLKKVEQAQMEQLAALLKSLDETDEGSGTLLNSTSVLFGSNLGNGNNHDNKNLPIILAGGGYKHGQHMAFDTQNNVPLSNVYVSMLQNLGLPMDKFGSSTGTLSNI